MYENISSKHQAVARAYEGGSQKNKTSVRKEVSVAVHVSWRAIDALGEILNGKHPDLLHKDGVSNYNRRSDMEEYLVTVDCRILRKLVCCSTIRTEKNFMKAVNFEQKESPDKKSLQVEIVEPTEELQGREEQHSVHPVLFGSGRFTVEEEVS